MAAEDAGWGELHGLVEIAQGPAPEDDPDTVLVGPGAVVQARGQLRELTREAVFWSRKAGAQHYDEHLPRLRECLTELRSDTAP